MNWQNIIAELLYIGIVAEKGRCYGVRWKYGYKKTLRKHIKALNLLQVSLQSDNIEKKKDALNSFINICNKNPKFGKFYIYAFQTLNDLQIEETNLVHHLKTDKLLDTLFHDVLTECSKMIISPKKIYYLLCSLHNLPRVYFDISKQGLLGENRVPITEEAALQYAFDNMDNYLKSKYKKYV